VTSKSPSAQLVARLLASLRAQRSDAPAAALDIAVAAFHRTSHELSRWVGVGGCQALLSRALKRAAAQHPGLSGIGLELGSPPHLTGLDEGVEAHGGKAMRAGLEASLVILYELMGRLIGDDLATKLAELSMTNGVPGAAQSPDGEPSA
jgi:hypothetical protein